MSMPGASMLTAAEVLVKYNTSSSVSTIRSRIEVIYEDPRDSTRLLQAGFDRFYYSAVPVANIRQFVYVPPPNNIPINAPGVVLWDSRYGRDYVDQFLRQKQVQPNPVP